MIPLLLAAALTFIFGTAFLCTVITPQSSDGPTAATLIGMIASVVWLGSQLAALV